MKEFHELKTKFSLPDRHKMTVEVEDEQKEFEIQKLWIEVPLDKSYENNIFNYNSIFIKHKMNLINDNAQGKSTVLISQEDTRETNLEAINDDDQYDDQDDFIDDSHLFNAELEDQELPLHSEYGYFAYKGPITAVLDNQAKKLQNNSILTKSTATGIVIPKLIDPPKPQVPEKKKVVKKKVKDTPLKSDKDTTVQDTPSKSQPTTVEASNINPTSSNSNSESLAAKAAMKPVPKPVERVLEKLRTAASKADFTVKKHFPPELKPVYKEAVICALDHNLFDENFFAHVINILPYNTFTVKKLAARLTFDERTQKIKKELPGMYSMFTKEATESLSNSGDSTTQKLKYRQLISGSRKN